MLMYSFDSILVIAIIACEVESSFHYVAIRLCWKEVVRVRRLECAIQWSWSLLKPMLSAAFHLSFLGSLRILSSLL